MDFDSSEGDASLTVDLSNKCAIVTGASRGIGRSIAESLVESGARVLVVSRKAEACEQVAAALGERAAPCAAHVGDEEQVRACIDTALELWGQIDIVVNNAGINPYGGALAQVDMARWSKMLQVNLTGPLLLAQQAWERSMRHRRGCSVVNVASTAGMTTGPLGPYGVTKAALLHLTEQLAVELAPSTRVNAVAPGVVRTEFARPMWDGPAAAEIEARIPVGRFGEPEDVAGIVRFLVSDDARWISGHTLVADGGALAGSARPVQT